jgi:hypothetical protein
LLCADAWLAAAGEVRSDPFEEFFARNCSYGYIGVGVEHPRMLRGLFEAVHAFMGARSRQPQPWFRDSFLGQDGAYNGNFFYNNFEM